MADLIDRQALLEWFKNWSDYDEFSVGYITGVIEDEPSAQPEPSEVARDIATIIENEIDMRVIAQSERKKGRWIDTESSYADGVRQECRCSVCSRLSSRPLGDFCKWCGTDMRGEEDG